VQSILLFLYNFYFLVGGRSQHEATSRSLTPPKTRGFGMTHAEVNKARAHRRETHGSQDPPLQAAREKHCGRNVKSLAQLLDVGFVEGAFPVQDFGDDTFRAKDGDQVFLAEIIGIHQGAKDFHGGRIGNGMVLFFVSFD
jgi:hypothetical protein